MSLLTKAKLVSTKRGKVNTYSVEEQELAVAWANDELALEQVRKILKQSSTSLTYSWLAQCLRVFIKKNGIKA